MKFRSDEYGCSSMLWLTVEGILLSLFEEGAVLVLVTKRGTCIVRVGWVKFGGGTLFLLLSFTRAVEPLVRGLEGGAIERCSFTNTVANI